MYVSAILRSVLPRWKQRDIHEKREMRKMHIAQLKADIACNEVLEPRIKQITQDVEAKGPAEFSSLVERFKTNPSPEAPPTNAPGQKSYDEMILSLMLKVWEDAKTEGVEKDDPKLGEALVKGLQKHITELGAHQEKLRKELAQEEAEQKKKITSDDIHEGWESHVRIAVALRRLNRSPVPSVRPAQARPATDQELDPQLLRLEIHHQDHRVRSHQPEGRRRRLVVQRRRRDRRERRAAGAHTVARGVLAPPRSRL